MSLTIRIGMLAALAATAVGCANVQAARSPAPMPMLNPPPSPVKVVIPSRPEPVPIEEPADTAAPVDPLATATPPAGAGRTPPPPPRRETPPAQPDPQVLRPGTNVARAERETRAQLQVADKVLESVRRSELSADGKAQFDEVTRFIRSANEALTVRNYLLARQLADKAVLLATVLVKGGLPPSAP